MRMSAAAAPRVEVLHRNVMSGISGLDWEMKILENDYTTYKKKRQKNARMD